ncbi:uncharacterized protein LOC144451625 [Glandiceps talaboti]
MAAMRREFTQHFNNVAERKVQADRKRKETHEESPATCIDIDYIHDITQSQCPSKGCSSIPGHITRTTLQNQAIATVTPIDSHTKYNGVADTTVVFLKQQEVVHFVLKQRYQNMLTCTTLML